MRSIWLYGVYLGLIQMYFNVLFFLWIASNYEVKMVNLLVKLTNSSNKIVNKSAFEFKEFKTFKDFSALNAEVFLL